MSLLDKIKGPKSPESGVSIEISNESPEMEKPMEEKIGMSMDPAAQEEIFSNYEDGDEEAIIELGPLGSIYEYVEPLAVQASDRQFIEFMHDLFAARKQMLESL